MKAGDGGETGWDRVLVCRGKGGQAMRREGCMPHLTCMHPSLPPAAPGQHAGDARCQLHTHRGARQAAQKSNSFVSGGGGVCPPGPGGSHYAPWHGMHACPLQAVHPCSHCQPVGDFISWLAFFRLIVCCCIVHACSQYHWYYLGPTPQSHLSFRRPGLFFLQRLALASRLMHTMRCSSAESRPAIAPHAAVRRAVHARPQWLCTPAVKAS